MGQERVKQMDLTDKQKEEWAQALCVAGVEAGVIAKVLREIAVSVIIMCIEFEKAMEQVANIARAGLIEAASEREEFEDLERELKMLDRPTAWDRKKARERRRAAEREAASRFRQYKASEKAWSARKRIGKRRREWRGPYREG